MGSDGTGERTLDPEGGQQRASWSPDGTEIVYQALPNALVAGAPASPVELRAIRPDGSGKRTLIGGGAQPRHAVWSPHGSRIAFLSGVPADSAATPAPGPSIETIDPSNGTVQVLVSADRYGAVDRAGRPCNASGSFLRVDFSVPAWSPDGDSIAAAGSGGLLVTPAPGVTNVLGNFGGSTSLVGPGWAPDGSVIDFVACRPAPSGGTETDVLLVQPDGTSLSQATGNVGKCDGSADAIPTPAAFAPSPLLRRFLGVSRVDTAVDVARNTFSSAPAVVIARDDLYPDALSGAALAAKLGGPLLLTDPRVLPGPVCDEIRALGATHAVILGDSGAVSTGVSSSLGGCGVTTVDRFSGATRFDTAAAVAAQVGGSAVDVTEGIDANPSRGWPDAVSVSALAAHQQRPILLVASDSLPAPTAHVLTAMGVKQVTIVGGAGVVSDQVAAQIASMGITVTRVAGANRYATSAAVADVATGAGLSPTQPWLAIGNNWPNALAAGPAAAHAGGNLTWSTAAISAHPRQRSNGCKARALP